MKYLGAVVALLAVVWTSHAGLAATTPQTAVPPGSVEAVTVAVTGGDTIKVRLPTGEIRPVRLIGIDTPEVVDPRKPVQCYGEAASKRMKTALPVGRHVW